MGPKTKQQQNKNNDKQQQYDHKMKCTAKNGWSKKSVVYIYVEVMIL